MGFLDRQLQALSISPFIRNPHQKHSVARLSTLKIQTGTWEPDRRGIPLPPLSHFIRKTGTFTQHCRFSEISPFERWIIHDVRQVSVCLIVPTRRPWLADMRKTDSDYANGRHSLPAGDHVTVMFMKLNTCKVVCIRRWLSEVINLFDSTCNGFMLLTGY